MSTLAVALSPYEKMEAWYAEHPQLMSFSWYVEFHLLHGFVFSTPDFFIMGRNVNKDAGADAICEPTNIFSKDESNCWMIHAMAGDCTKAWSILPYPLPWLAFERTREGRKELQLIPSARIRDLCGLPPTR